MPLKIIAIVRHGVCESIWSTQRAEDVTVIDLDGDNQAEGERTLADLEAKDETPQATFNQIWP